MLINNIKIGYAYDKYMNIDNIITFCHFFKSIINELSNEINTKVLTFREILYCCLYMNGCSCSYSLANINMYLHDIIDVTDTTLKLARDEVDFKHFKKINNMLLNFIYLSDNKQRIIGVDGTYIQLPIELKDYGFNVSENNTYCIALVSSVYDISNDMLINYRLHKRNDERAALMKQMNYLRKGDILIMDRGYYSKKLLSALVEKGIEVVFRMQVSSLLIKELIKKGQESMKTSINYNDKEIAIRIITYKINDVDYYLLTTIMNHTPAYFKELYWQRWNLETNFRESKYVLSMNNILSRSENKVQQDIYSHSILFLVLSYFKKCIQESLPLDKFINSKNLMYLVVEKILYIIMYKKITKKTKKNLKKYANRFIND